MDMNRIDDVVTVDTTEIWQVENGRQIHNFHLHDVQSQVLDIDGAPPARREAELLHAYEQPTVPRNEGDTNGHEHWPDHLTVTRNSGVDFYYEQYRRLLVREESLLKERDSLRRENAALRSWLRKKASTPTRMGRPASMALALPLSWPVMSGGEEDQR
jgi:hypothetical protein